MFVRIIGEFVQQLQNESMKDGMQLLHLLKQVLRDRIDTHSTLTSLLLCVYM